MAGKYLVFLALIFLASGVYALDNSSQEVVIDENILKENITLDANVTPLATFYDLGIYIEDIRYAVTDLISKKAGVSLALKLSDKRTNQLMIALASNDTKKIDKIIAWREKAITKARNSINAIENNTLKEEKSVVLTERLKKQNLVMEKAKNIMRQRNLIQNQSSLLEQKISFALNQSQFDEKKAIEAVQLIQAKRMGA